MPKKKKIRVKAKKDSGGEEIGSFEESLHELESIVRELESGNLSLADSLEKYEVGIKNLKSCHRILEAAENRIRLLTGVDREGNPVTEDFEGQETELYERSSKRTIRSVDEEDEDDVMDDEGSLF